MSSFSNGTSNPPKDGYFTHLTVTKPAVTGLVPRDIAFNNLLVRKTDPLAGIVRRDLNVTNLGVNNVTVGPIYGNGARFIGRI